MRLMLNGEAFDCPDGLSVRALIELLGLTSGPVAVERNQQVVPRAEHTSTILQNEDQVEVVHLVGGG